MTYGRQVFDALEAANKLAADGISLEVIDIRSLYPLDEAMIGESVDKTHHAVVLTEETRRGGYGGEISATPGVLWRRRAISSVTLWPGN